MRIKLSTIGHHFDCVEFGFELLSKQKNVYIYNDNEKVFLNYFWDLNFIL